MNTTKILKTILLSALVLITAVAAASAQDKMTTMRYAMGEETVQMVEVQHATGPDNPSKEKRQATELNATQWIEVIRVLEGLLGLPATEEGRGSMGATERK